MTYTPSIFVYKARTNMVLSSELYFDHYFSLYYFIYGYELIIIVSTFDYKFNHVKSTLQN
jgi:hypothetical protein